MSLPVTRAVLPAACGMSFVWHSNKLYTDQLEDKCKRVLQLGQECPALAMFGAALGVNQDDTR